VLQTLERGLQKNLSLGRNYSKLSPIVLQNIAGVQLGASP
jgi:hypothetical protein